ncbi:putative dienelactone hydrolase, alpha/Beta hydrolase [Helianthus annuus]|nr:putative dienelactone hydrolase, alpha/Beta hydrolase [Helianthus annuus]
MRPKFSQEIFICIVPSKYLPPSPTLHTLQTEMGLNSTIFMASATSSSTSLLRPPFTTFSPNLQQLNKICNLRINSDRRSSIRRDKCRRLCCSQVQIENETNEEACELVSGVEVSIGEGSDSVAAYLLTAVKNNNGTGILLLSDIFGFEDSCTRDFAYRIACNGYNVLLPDLFNGDPWQKDRSMASFEPWLATHTQTATTNIAASIKWMVESFVAAGISNKLGIVGFCFGGGKVIEVLAEDSDDRFGVGVSFYGTGIQPSVAAKIKVPVLYITGDEDPLCSVKVLEDIGRDNVGGSKVVVFNGRGHAFVHRPSSSEEDKDAEEAFTIMRNWLHNGLVVEK